VGRWIPAYAEADNLPGVLADVPTAVAGLATHVLVIDDGSRDATAAVAPAHGAEVVSQPMNSGQGAALQTFATGWGSCG
jgi:glycosyltransferase involved in cell wall biosynthesis